MLRTQRVFNWEEQFSIWTDVCPTITTESQQKGSHSPGCACAHHGNTRMEDAGRSALVISLNARTHTHSLVLRRELRCQPFCCPVRPYSLLTTAELCYRILLCVHFPNNLELMCRPMEMCVFFVFFNLRGSVCVGITKVNQWGTFAQWQYVLKSHFGPILLRTV